MAVARVERRLAAILEADVAGYSRLMGVDEEGTLATLKRHRRDLIDPKIAEHHGRIVKTTGDGALVEFGSAVDAVRCAMEIQHAMAERNAAIAENLRIEFRIGINVGDIIIDDNDIYGDGVNIAARVEALASPGAICLSENAYQQIKGKLAINVSDMGEQQLKNISHPIRVYSVHLNTAATRPALPLPDRPSIAVLPFQNMSGDPEQEYFADGMVEDIITALSRFKSLFVIARNSSFTYKGRAVNIKQAGRELGVRYILEGSVRKVANRVRITGQLIDALTGAHLWADRFDGGIEDIFDLQDQVTTSVVGAIAPKLEQAEIERAKLKPTESLDAYDLYLRGMAELNRRSHKSNADALLFYYQAIESDPSFASAYGRAAECLAWNKANGWVIDRPREIEKVKDFARVVQTLGKGDAVALASAAFALAYVAEELDTGAAMIARSLSLNQNMASAWHFSGWIRLWLGEPEEGIADCQRAIRLSPLDDNSAMAKAGIAFGHFFCGRYEQAVQWAQEAEADRPEFLPAKRIAAAAFAFSGDLTRAAMTMERLRELAPELRVSNLREVAPFRRNQDLGSYAEGLRRAGLPE